MKYALYGLPCAGKSTLLNNLSVTVINGSTELNKMVSGRFSLLPKAEKRECRIRYAKKLLEISDEFISDGHYAFPDGVVFTEADGDLYDVFLYLYCKPEIISERLKNSSKNSRFAHISVENIHKWQSFEIESLRAECHKRYKNFCVINDISSMELQDLIKRIRNGFGSYQLARSITDKIQKIYPVPCELHICDGDKTIIKQDSFKICTENYITNAFDGNFYTDYQYLKFSEEVHNLKYNTDNLDKIQLNNIIYEKVCCRNYIVLSSGIGIICKKLAENIARKRL
ncbi:MAG: AAA family ATPase [Ruminococcus sp.]|nr:AAA family ATPase [Ruminococcus sp.]